MSNIKVIAETFFTGTWQMMLQTKIPGTSISIAGLCLSVLIISMSIRVIGYLTGFRMGSYGAAASAAEKGKNLISRKKQNSGE